MASGEKIRVMIVDDVSETRENVRKLLQFESDVDVVGVARTGKEAIQLSQELNPDVVLMDINMPDMDGISATELIRSKQPAVQVVILSVHACIFIMQGQSKIDSYRCSSRPTFWTIYCYDLAPWSTEPGWHSNIASDWRNIHLSAFCLLDLCHRARPPNGRNQLITHGWFGQKVTRTSKHSTAHIILITLD